MEYRVVVRINIRSLEEDVNDLINQGWMPHGNLVVDATEHSVRYLQPMIKYKSSTTLTEEFKPIEETFTTTGIKDNEFDISVIRDVPASP